MLFHKEATHKKKSLWNARFAFLKPLNFFAAEDDGEEEEEEEEEEEDEEADDTSKGKKSAKKSGGADINALLTKVRKDEKEKHFRRIVKAETAQKEAEKAKIVAEMKVESLENQITGLEAKLSQRGDNESEEVTKLRALVIQLEGEKRDLDIKVKAAETVNKDFDEDAARDEIRKEIEAEYAVELYRVKEIAKYSEDELLFPDEVVGTTTDEIDEALEAALEKSKNLIKRLSRGTKSKKSSDDYEEEDEDEEEEELPKRKPASSTKKKRPVHSNPSPRNIFDKNMSADAISRMTPEEYAKWRKTAGL